MFIESYFNEQNAIKEINRSKLRQIAIDTSEKFQQLINETNKSQIEEEKEEIKEKEEVKDLKNLGTQFLTNDYESIPVAPSMINKRKPPQMFDFSDKKRGISPNPQVEKKNEKRQQSSFSVDATKLKTKKNFKLGIQIDTESINELYTYGGEKGKKVKIDEDEFKNEWQNIKQLAAQCVAYMNGQREKDFYETKMPENKSIKQEVPMTTKNAKVPQLLLKQQLELNTIKENSISVNNSSASIQQVQNQNRSNSLVESVVKQKIKWNGIYISLVGWMIDKLNVDDSEELMIEDGDLIKNGGVLNLICQLYNILNKDDLLKVQIVQDLLCLAKSDAQNTYLMFSNEKVHGWLLNLLLKCKTEKQDENQKLLWEIGSRLYTTVISSLIGRQQKGWNKIQELIEWQESNKGQSDILVRLLLCQLFELIQEQCKNYQPSLAVVLWANLINIGFNLIQLLIGQRLDNINQNTPYQMLNYLKNDLWLDYDMVFHYIALMDLLFTEILPILKSPHKQEFIKEIFINDNKRLFTMIQSILIYETQNGQLDFIRILFCIYEAFLQSGIKEKNQQRIAEALQKLETLLISLAIYSEYNQTSEIAVEHFLNIFNYLFQLRDNNIYENLHSLIQILIYIIQTKPNGFTYTLFKRQLILNIDQLDSSIIDSSQFRAYLMQASESHFGLNSEKVKNAMLAQNIILSDKAIVQKSSFDESIKKDVLILGEEKQAEQEEKRKFWLMIESEKERTGRNYFKKIWKRQRFFNGYFSRKDFFNHIDYSHMRVQQLETKQKARPFMKFMLTDTLNLRSPISFGNQTSPILSDAYIIEPPNQQSQLEQGAQQIYKAANQLYNIGKFWGNNIKNTIKTILPNPSAIGQQLFNLQKENENIKSILEDGFTYKRVQWIRTLTVRNGFLSLGHDSLIFQYEFIIEKPSHTCLKTHHLSDNKRLVKLWSLDLFREIIRKKYLQRKSALEIFLMDGRSIFLNFIETQDMEEVSNKLAKLKKTIKCPYLKHKSMDVRKIPEKSLLTKMWQRGEISNFYYLMQLNSLASRSYNDITQYPVFPWIITDYQTDQSPHSSHTPSTPPTPSNPQKEPKKTAKQALHSQIEIYPPGQFRNLQLTMGALGSEHRIKSYLERFENSDPNGDIPPFHFGSHYSSPAIISQYLIRIQPFTNAAIEIQGGKFDIPDRLFYSIYESYKCATEDVADVRELIPDMFFLPEMFMNMQNLQFGKTQGHIQVGDVILPKWASGSPFKFVVGLKQALESDYISNTLPEWLDIIFGYKSRGKEAVKALNTFFYLTYDDLVDLDKIDDSSTRISVETQIINFGQTPLQLFLKQHVGRHQEDPKQAKMITQFESEIKVYRPQGKKKQNEEQKQSVVNISNADGKAIIKIKWISQVRLICIRRDGKIDHLKWWSTGINTTQPIPSQVPFSCGLEKQSQVNLQKGQKDILDMTDDNLDVVQYPIEVLNFGKILVCGGYWDGKLILFNSENGNVIQSYDEHKKTIVCIKSDKKENYIISGSKDGNCIYWKVGRDYELQVKQSYFDHSSKINVIYISGDLKLFGTGCQQGLVNLYNIYSGKLIKCINVKQEINAMVLSANPLACVVVQSQKDRRITSYSINGFLLESVFEECQSIVCSTIIRDKNFQDALVYGTESGELVMRALPFLQTYKRFLISQNSAVLSLSTTKDKKFVLCGCNDGELSVMTEPQLKQD